MKTMSINLINLPKVELKNLKQFFSPKGSKDKTLYKYVYDEKYGCPRRVVSGSMDLYAYVQEGRDQVDFSSLGKMLVDTKANIVDHFVSKDGQVIDITGQPRNIHEAVKLMSDLQDSFDQLPTELKALFDNDFDSFRASYKAGTIGSKFESYYSSLTPPVEEVKKEGE